MYVYIYLIHYKRVDKIRTLVDRTSEKGGKNKQRKN